jgi:hypothetical protein
MRVEINFAYDWEDMRSSAHFLSPPAVPLRQKRIRLLLAVVIFGTFAVVMVGLFRRWPDRYLGVPAILLLALILLGKLHEIRVALIRSGLIAASPRINVVLAEAEITITKRRRTASVPWSKIEGAIFAEAGIFLRQDGGGGILLPRRAFVGESNYDDVVVWLDGKANPATLASEAVGTSETRTSGASYSPAPANAPLSYNDIITLERYGMLAVAVGWLGGMIVGGIMAMFVRQSHDWVALIPMGLGHLYQAWGCGALAIARGFRRIHGVLLGLVPLFGVLFIATRARPEPGERIDRQSWRGFLSAPFARQSDISSWSS